MVHACSQFTLGVSGWPKSKNIGDYVLQQSAAFSEWILPLGMTSPSLVILWCA